MKIKVYETLKDLFKKYRACDGHDIDYEEAKIIMKNDTYCVLLDVRSPQEYKEGNLENSINIPLYDIAKEIDKEISNKETTIIVYCQSGNRSKKAVEILCRKGYQNIYNILGGMDNM